MNEESAKRYIRRVAKVYDGKDSSHKGKFKSLTFLSINLVFFVIAFIFATILAIRGNFFMLIFFGSLFFCNLIIALAFSFKRTLFKLFLSGGIQIAIGNIVVNCGIISILQESDVYAWWIALILLAIQVITIIFFLFVRQRWINYAAYASNKGNSSKKVRIAQLSTLGIIAIIFVAAFLLTRRFVLGIDAYAIIIVILMGFMAIVFCLGMLNLLSLAFLTKKYKLDFSSWWTDEKIEQNAIDFKPYN
ncbi:MAG: hypothetical protein FWC80_04980 [Firmicutes bacterium]|nr:hypothetical protein [Bacillota bacterium]